MDLETLIQLREFGGSVFDGLILFVIAWLRVKPFLRGAVAGLKKEMSSQMNAVREEMGKISGSVAKLSENLTSLEKAQTNRFEKIEDRLEKLETKGG